MHGDMAEVAFGAEELFFSTTDGKGVIEQANDVFVRLSGYPFEELVGAPHNIIRHDDMPGGAFKLMWQTLQAGDPFCAYVVNRSASGAPYTVFATITPLGDGYLSVRSRPCVDVLRETAFGLYADTRRTERELSASGQPGPAVAAAGLEHLAGLVRTAGLSGYDEFIREALPAEVGARAAMAGELAVREGDGTLHELLSHVHTLREELSGWFARLEELAALTTALREGAASLREAMEASARTAAEVTEAAGAGAAPIMLAVNLWASMMPEIEGAIDELLAGLAELATSSSQTRFRIALAQLHADATGQFVVELIDHADADESTAAGRGSGVTAIKDLARALDEGLAATLEQARHNAELAEQASSRIEAVRELMLVPQGLLGNWQEMAVQRSDDRAAALVPTMAAQMADGDRNSLVLAELAEQCRAQAQPLDGAPLEAEVAEIGRIAAQLSRPRRGI